MPLLPTRRLWPACLVLISLAGVALGQREYGFDNRKPSGQPYLPAAESVKRMKLPPGWEVNVYAAEPDIINPIAFTIDERGRLWVVECFEYPTRTPPGSMPRDRIKVLEDTDGDGRCDKVTVWAEGKHFPVRFDLASGIEVGHGGVFLGAPPYLFFLRDTDGDGRCDKHEILLSGFGSQDTHETLNTFQWGPDGRLYGLHGVFTHSEVQGVKLNAAVWRYDVRAKKFDVFAEGTSNPWGMDFDAQGQNFLACCVIPHLFHMIPGGTYKRQAGASFHPYAYGLLNEICDHTHHKESGWAHAGLVVLDGRHVPEEFRGSVLMGSIHGCSIKRDVLRRRGSTFIASHAEDFLVSGDKNFRPINIRWGADGALYVIDWHDQNPCHQAPPDSWDKKHGRVYRIQRAGAKAPPAVDLARKSDQELVELLLGEDNPYRYRTALRLLGERRGRIPADLTAYLRRRALEPKQPAGVPLALRALWGLEAVGGFNEDVAADALRHPDPWVRAWAIRLAGEPGQVSAELLKQLTELARTEPAPEVRLQLASTARRLAEQDTLPLLHHLMTHKGDADDPAIPLMLWLAYEPKTAVAADPRNNPALDWLRVNAAGNPLVTNEIVPRTIRRLLATGRREDLAACVEFLAATSDKDVRRQALRGFIEALKNRQVEPPPEWDRVFAELMKTDDPEVRRLAQQLAVHFRDARAVTRALALLQDPKSSRQDRLDAIRALALAHPPEAVGPLVTVLHDNRADEEVRRAAVAALASFEDRDIPKAVLDRWASYPPSVRTEAVNVLKGRKEWARALLEAVGRKQVPQTDVTAGAILAIRSYNDRQLNELIDKVWGRFRETPAELEKLLATMRGVLHEGCSDFARGRKVFEKNCMQCHRFDGQGHAVGPDLDGAERSIEYLLINILDPNRVVGQPYYTRIILTEGGQLKTGLVVAEDDRSVTLKRENNQVEVIQKTDIAQDKTETRSLMPEGLDQNITPQDFRDLVRYLMANPFLTEVYVSAPVAAGGAVEAALAAPQTDPLRIGGLMWSTPAVGPAGRIALAHVPVNAAREPVQYVYAPVMAPAELKTRLLIGANSRVTVWHNGKRIGTLNDPAPEASPDQHAIEVTLTPGMNRFVFQVSNKPNAPALYARLHDPDRKLSYPAVKP
jgi:putative membrane-bound dehydrogenase-like protein